MFTEADIQTAIRTITDGVTVTRDPRPSHHASVVSGLEDAPVIEALGIYLAGCVGTAIRVDLEIALDLLGNQPNEVAQLRRSVESIIGADNNVNENFKETRRDPWITEGIAHLCAMLSRDHVNLGPPGRIEAVTLVHPDVTEHGLDQLAIFHEAPVLGVSIGEAKASDQDIGGNLTEAAVKFREVEIGIHDPDIRTTINYLRGSLPQALQSLITQTFWSDRRTFQAYAAYPVNDGFDHRRARPALGALNGAPDTVNVVCLALDDYSQFFDDVADAIREAVEP